MKIGFLCIAQDKVEATAPSYQGVARATIADRLVGEFDSFSVELLKEWSHTADDEWSAFLSTLHDARSVVASYAKRGICCDLLQVATCESATDAKVAQQETGFLGFDVASIAPPESAIFPFPSYPDDLAPELAAWVPVWRLERAFVDDHLNQNGLLDTYEVARTLLDAVNAMRALVNPVVPGTFLDVKYRVLAIARAATSD